jgi:hypothetical protein
VCLRDNATLFNKLNIKRIDMRLTQEVTLIITEYLLVKRNKECAEILSSIQDKVKIELLKHIPKTILEAYKEYPRFFDVGTFAIKDNNNIFHYVDIAGVPRMKHNSSIVDHINDQQFIDQMANELTKLSNLKSDIKKKKKEMMEVIYSMKTSNNLKINFPEAYSVLEGKGLLNKKVEVVNNNLPATKLNSLVDWLNK